MLYNEAEGKNFQKVTQLERFLDTNDSSFKRYLDFPKLGFGSSFSICLREDSPNVRNSAKQLYIRDDNAGCGNRDLNYGGLKAELGIRLQSPGLALCVLIYILSIAWVATVFGIGDAVAFVLHGQLINSVYLVLLR